MSRNLFFRDSDQPCAYCGVQVPGSTNRLLLSCCRRPGCKEHIYSMCYECMFRMFECFQLSERAPHDTESFHVWLYHYVLCGSEQVADNSQQASPRKFYDPICSWALYLQCNSQTNKFTHCTLQSFDGQLLVSCDWLVCCTFVTPILCISFWPLSFIFSKFVFWTFVNFFAILD